MFNKKDEYLDQLIAEEEDNSINILDTIMELLHPVNESGVFDDGHLAVNFVLEEIDALRQAGFVSIVDPETGDKLTSKGVETTADEEDNSEVSD